MPGVSRALLPLVVLLLVHRADSDEQLCSFEDTISPNERCEDLAGDPA